MKSLLSVVVFVSIGALPSFAQETPHVVSTSPTQNELNVATSTDISVVFDTEMDASTINDSTLVLNGRYTGLLRGTITYDSPTRTATFGLASDLPVGEVVTVVLTEAIQSSQAIPLEQGYVWSFTTLVEDGSTVFVTDSAYQVGSNPHAVLTADLDGDGDVDVAVSNYDLQTPYDPDSVWVFLNRGDATFTPDSVYPAGLGGVSLVGADLDGDGDIDLATANVNGDNISVLLNNGDGTFGPPSFYSVQRVNPLFCADLDGDGDLDLAAAGAIGSQSWVSVLLNHGDGSFTTDSTYPGGLYSILSADLDGDGDLDLATSNSSPDVVSILFNNGDGTFADGSSYEVGETPLSIFGADLDGDGDIDLTTANKFGDNLSVLRNNGDGTFRPRADYDVVHDSPYSVFACDLDGDRDLDLTAATYGNYDEGGAAVLLNNGLGFFSLDSIYSAVNSFSVSSADLDGDRDLDLVLATHYPHQIAILLNKPETSISGVIFDDENANGTQDQGEEGLQRWMVVLEPGGHAAMTDSNGAYTFRRLESATYTVSEVLKPHREQTYPPPPGTHVVPLDTGDIATGIDFGNRAPYDTLDGRTLLGFTRLRPGRSSRFTLQCENIGTVAWDSARIEITLPYELEPDSPGVKEEWRVCNYIFIDDGDNYVGEITVGSIGPDGQDACTDRVFVPETDTCGQQITGIRRRIYMSSEGEWQETDELTTADVLCPEDPNEKRVSPRDTIGLATTLSYRIDFQNVGNDTAFDIVVIDTLHPNLDITTFDLGAHSHNYEFDITGRELSWTFHNILLPDSTENEPRSHGFIEYTVKPRPDLPIGTVIQNRAAIYFDFNPPVMTNTVTNTIGPVRVDEQEIEPASARFELLQNYPNPFAPGTQIHFGLSKSTHVRLEIYNLMGQKVASLVDRKVEAGQHTVEWQGRDSNGRPVPTGLYFYRLTAGNFTSTRKMTLLR